MAKLTKKQKSFEGKVDSNKLYSLTDAIAIIKECANAKFDESIDVAVHQTRCCVRPGRQG
jgi:large subunit ribosomal protein L1